MRIVLDTNVLVSGIFFSGPPSEILKAWPFPNQICEDPDDDKFLACALASGSSTIVSGDKHLLKLSGFRGLNILTPRAFAERYLKK